MDGLVLSLFPGIGLLDRAFEEAGFCVVRGPDMLWGGDIRDFHPPRGRFDGVIGGPPCPSFSRLRYLVQHNGYETAPDMMEHFDRILTAACPTWFLCENVPQHPGPRADDYSVTDFVLDNRWVGGEQQRQRRFWFGRRGKVASDLRQHITYAALEPAVWRPTVTAAGGTKTEVQERRSIKANEYGHASTDYLRRAVRDQGLPDDFLAHAPFTVAGKIKVVGNGVPLPMGRAIAQAVKQAVMTHQ